MGNTLANTYEGDDLDSLSQSAVSGYQLVLALPHVVAQNAAITALVLRVEKLGAGPLILSEEAVDAGRNHHGGVLWVELVRPDEPLFSGAREGWALIDSQHHRAHRNKTLRLGLQNWWCNLSADRRCVEGH